ncbi:MAG: polysaccharide biosynthesis/export family protein [Chitinispirillaceae bacterium]|nr:polysaccharide biosynthesis/export family protein [Chitinispirillaceae bacterium]
MKSFRFLPRHGNAFFLFVSLLSLSTGNYAQTQQSPDIEHQPAQAVAPKSLDAVPSAALPDAALRFQAGDGIRIIAYPDSAGFPSGVYAIDSHGYADLPIVGYINVVETAPKQIEELLIEKYAAYLPRLSVIVRPVYRISLLGGFLQPGLYWIDPRESLWNAVQKAGGTHRDDGIKKIRWVRDSGRVTKNILPYFQSGASLYSIGFKSGDQLCVTPMPRRQLMESIQTNVLPFFTIVLTAASVYATYQYYTSR